MNFPSTKQVNLDIQSNYPSIQAGKTFWDDNGYEAVVRRFENGKRLSAFYSYDLSYPFFNFCCSP